MESQKSLLQNRNFKQHCAQLGVIRDMNGIFSCKGTLCNSPLPETAKFPAWLPCDHHITKLIIRDCHHKVMHNGVRETLTELRSRFWLTKGRQVIRKHIYNCEVCRRYEGRSYKVEPSSDMPEFRFKEGYPFSSTGVDFAGPLFVKTVFGREIQVSKVYICLFTCGSTWAIHIELTPSLTTQAFIRCRRRFVARRGIPELIISDNAKTFKAAATQLTRIFNDPGVTSFLLRRKIQWKYNLEKAPWWGGWGGVWRDDQEYEALSEENAWKGSSDIWGALDSSNWSWVHTALQAINLSVSRRSGGTFHTIHVISGRRLLSLPDATRSGTDNSSTHETRTRTGRYLQKLMDHLWNRWRREYIPALREAHRLNLHSAGQTAQIGDIVSVHDESLPRTKWRMGVVHELIKGVDNKDEVSSCPHYWQGKEYGQPSPPKIQAL